ncbi:magnesium transporter [Candidatus Oleimmundimicrobium sp.]|uniref:magnesium transporter n=1 Tax=Candidatus Oleimmundimicrobium sp. TaxID=3060597 RepID=UPI00272373C1|nr:magnesium transporter [Candidatus Oleimmundimicrobium sp.]MDO8885838.1 magnesium transporter [Candidatus Oleimmundimicrobium sp.]
MEERNEIILKTVNRLLAENKLSKVTTILGKLYSADAAEVVTHLDERDQKKIFEVWAPDQSANTLLEMEEDDQVDIAESLSISAISEILNEMPSDDGADLIADLSKETAEKIFKVMKPEAAAEIRNLLKHDEKTAGGLMNPEVVTLKKSITTEEAIDELRKKAPEIENIYYVFVVNDENQLVGVVSLRDLIIASPKTLIKDIMNPNVIYVEAGVDQEEAAKIISKYDLLALPVVDQEQRLLGVITVDDVLDVVEDEATEDMYKLSGTIDIEESDVMRSPFPRVLQARLPWLAIAVVGEVVVVGTIAEHFKYLLATLPALAVYWACMTSVGGNCSFQASTVAVRDLAIGHINSKAIFLRIIKEMRLALVMGIITGGILFVIAFFWQKYLPLAIVVAVANVLIIILGAFTGTVAPLLFNSMGIDPAVSSNPFLALIMDAISLFIYFYIAALVLGKYSVF